MTPAKKASSGSRLSLDVQSRYDIGVAVAQAALECERRAQKGRPEGQYRADQQAQAARLWRLHGRIVRLR